MAMKLETQLRRAVADGASARERRDALIREMRDEGWSYRQISELADISHTQVATVCGEVPVPG